MINFRQHQALTQVRDSEESIAEYPKTEIEHPILATVTKQSGTRDEENTHARLNTRSIYVLSRRMTVVAYTWSQCLLDQQRFDESLVNLTIAKRLGFPLPGILLRTSLAKIGLGQIDDAMETIYKLIDIEQDNPHLYILRAKLYRSLKNVDFANIDLQRACRLQPDHPEIPELQQYVLSVAVDLKNQASSQMLKHQPNTAIWYLNHAIELDSADWTSIFRRGVLLAEIHNYDSAIEDLLTVLSNPVRDISRDQEVKNHIGSIYNKIGVIAYQNGALKDAILKFTTALTFNSKEPVVWKNRAGNSLNQIDYKIIM